MNSEATIYILFSPISPFNNTNIFLNDLKKKKTCMEHDFLQQTKMLMRHKTWNLWKRVCSFYKENIYTSDEDTNTLPASW